MAKAKERRERRIAERSSSDPFSLALQRYADAGEKKRTTEKLKWTPTGARAARRGGISTDERTVLHLGLLILLPSEIFKERYSLLTKKTQNFPLPAKIFIIFASTINSWDGKGGV